MVKILFKEISVDYIKIPKHWMVFIAILASFTYGKPFKEVELFLEIPITKSTGGLSNHFEDSWGGFGFNGLFVFNKYFGVLGDLRVSDMGYSKKNFEYDGNWTTEHNVAMLSANINWTFYNYISRNVWVNPYVGAGVGTIKTNGDKNDELENYGLGPTIMPTLGTNFLFRKINPLFFLFPGGLTFKVEMKKPIYNDKRFNGSVYQFNVGYGFGSYSGSL
jgi:hypothetical protein